MSVKIDPIGKVKPKIGHRFKEETLAEVAEKAVELDEAGSASWSIKYSIPSIRGNRIEKFTLILKLTMGMPVWPNYPKRPQKEKNEWDRFYKALRFHEDQHHAVCKRLAHIMHQKLLNEKKIKDFKRVFNSEQSKFELINKKFDEDVDHGMKQESPFGTTVIDVP